MCVQPQCQDCVSEKTSDLENRARQKVREFAESQPYGQFVFVTYRLITPQLELLIRSTFKKMSRFFHGGDSDSESSSSDEEELYSDHEKAEASEEESDAAAEDSDDDSSSDDDEGKGTGANRFLKPSGGGAAEDSDESEDEDRATVVKSAKDKRLEEVEGTIRLIDNAEKINDWAVISTGLYMPHSKKI